MTEIGVIEEMERALRAKLNRRPIKYLWTLVSAGNSLLVAWCAKWDISGMYGFAFFILAVLFAVFAIIAETGAEK